MGGRDAPCLPSAEQPAQPPQAERLLRTKVRQPRKNRYSAAAVTRLNAAISCQNMTIPERLSAIGGGSRQTSGKARSNFLAKREAQAMTS